MKMTKMLVGAALFALASLAQATCQNGATNWPNCTLPTVVNPQPISNDAAATSAAQSRAAAEAAARAQAGAAARSGDVSATNTATGNGGSAAGGAGGSVNDTSQYNANSRSYGLALALPNPIQLASMAGVNCPTPDIKQDSSYWLWGANAGASASTNTDSCVLMNGYAAYLSMCQFGNANKLLGMLMSSKLKGFEPEGADLPNMGPDECARFKLQSVQAPSVQTPAVPAALISSSTATEAAPLPLVAAKPTQTCRKGQLLSPGGRCYTPVKPKPAAVRPPVTCKVALPCRSNLI